ncbi:glycosyltransferase [Methanosphaera sp.]|jgi:glycosyltransferase involved in cell wall biosynthesis|uniref:glycosyltransferase n=1 Tax=Methanosphaera sp. TaxID=2666342 RepID=UPI002A79DD92|nr:glycosyltransferase [Methanosphaera sp.]
MNILQIIPYFSFTRGGDVNVCYNLTKQLIKKGHTVTILTTTMDYNKEDTDKIPNLTMVPLPYVFNLALFIYSPKIKSWLKENIEEYDVIHLHELRSYQNNIVIKYAEKYNIPYVLQPHASTPKHISKSFIKNVYDKLYGNKIMQNASSVIAVSEEEAYYDKQMHAKDIELIYNGMNIEEYNQLPPQGTFRNKHINAPYILYLGRMDGLKGINHLIEAFSLLPEKYSEYKLVIAGKITNYKTVLDKIINDKKLENRVIFTGFIKEEDKISIYHDAEVFVNPVKYMGGVSITVFEALLSDTPVIVTPESGELIEKIGAGKIIEYGNIELLKTAMIESLEDKETTSTEIRKGQEYIKSNLQWSTVSDKIISVYEKVIGKRQ